MVRWLTAWIFFAVSFEGLQAQHPTDPRTWNVLFVTADDMNADSPGWMGNPLQPTPQLDAFATTAHRFIHQHVTAPICQPSRSAIMTGLVPHRNGALGFHPIRSGTTTWVSRMKEAGWFTAVIDKHPHMKPDNEFPWDLKRSGSGKNPSLFGKHVHEAIQAAKSQGKPFFLNANITDPHRPFFSSQQGKAKANDKGKNASEESNQGFEPFTPEQVTVPSFLENIPEVQREVAQYYSSLRRLDLSFGELLQALRESGEEPNTLILFMSDHGMSFPFSKATVYRNGTWSPLLVRWPGMGTPQVREEFISSVDLLPSVLELLHLQPMETSDGRSWLPLLQGKSQEDRDFVITHVNSVSSGKSFPQRCIRTKDFSYQFHAWPDGTPQFKVEAMNGMSYSAMAKQASSDKRIQARVQQLIIGERQQFFDLRLDPDERVNRISESKYAEILARLRMRLLDHMVKTNDPQLENFKKTQELN